MSNIYNFAKGRAAFYYFFYVAFKGHLNKHSYSFIRGFAPYFAALAKETSCNHMQAGASILSSYPHEPSTALLTEINADYNLAFNEDLISIPVDESSYLTKNYQLIETYKRYSFKLPTGFTHPIDHIATEMLFLHTTLMSIADASQNRHAINKLIDLEKDFFIDHVNLWAHLFINRLENWCKRTDKTKRYIYSTSQLLKGFIEVEKRILL